MKHFYSKNFYKTIPQVILTVAFLFQFLFSFSQDGNGGNGNDGNGKTALEYIFSNPVLESGVAGQDGAVYRFSNVSNNVDALVTINARSSSLVTLDSVDVTSTGYDKAFQPLVTYNGGTAQGPVSWWMEFVVTFVKSGKNNGAKMDSLKVTALDVDGDNSTLQEQFTAYGASNYTVNSPTNLSIGSVTGGTQFTGPILNSPGIDTSATNVMVTLTYVNQNSITFRYGGQVTSASASGSANRFNSIWFKAFNFNTSVPKILPVYLLSFDAALNNNSSTGLNWVTSSEKDASHFVVQRSTDGNNYTDQAIVFTQEGNSSLERKYNYTDNISSVKSSLVYYRLKMVDLDGRYNYSEVVVVRLGKQQEQMSLVAFPNPATSQVRVTIPTGWQNTSVVYSIYNLNGNLVKEKMSGSAGQTETFNIADLPVGFYIIKASSGNNEAVKQFIKVK
jgi:hypothetical protein